MKSPQKKYNAKKKRLAKKCNDLWRTIVLLKHPSCWHSGKEAVLSHHFVAKSLSNALRYDTENGVALSWSSHQRLHDTADPEILEKFLKSKDEKWHKYISENRRKSVTLNLAFYETTILRLEEELKKIK